MVPHTVPCPCINCRLSEMREHSGTLPIVLVPEDTPARPQNCAAEGNSEEEMHSPLSAYARELIVHEPDDSGPSELTPTKVPESKSLSATEWEAMSPEDQEAWMWGIGG